MGRFKTWGAAARRSPVTWALVTVAVLALVAGGVVLATRPGARSPGPGASARTSTRAVALGDSVPYGHGLHNPYLTPQVGLPAGWVSQGPSTAAYPSQVASDNDLFETVALRLGDQERQILDLRAQGWEWAEIAARLGGSPQARRMQLARAVHRVAKTIKTGDLHA